MPAAVDVTETARNENCFADINAGLITLAPALEDKLLPTWLGLDVLDATSTSKGCYPGQEIVARLHFKGGNKRWLHRLTFSAECLPEPGATLGPEGDDVGLIISAAWTGADAGAALAVLGEGDSERLKNLSSPAIVLHTIDNATRRIAN
jgi:folate-binding protein YgfZ